MIRKEDLTPWQNRVGRRAVRFFEQRNVFVLAFVISVAASALILHLMYSRLENDPKDALLVGGATGFAIAAAAFTLANDPFVSLAGRLYREVDDTGFVGSGDARGVLPAASGVRGGLGPAEQRMMESARRIGRFGWGSVRGAVLVVLASGVATIAAALARFGSEAGGLGAAALGMAAAGGLSVGVAIGLLILTRWMRLAERLGGPPGDAGTSP